MGSACEIPSGAFPTATYDQDLVSNPAVFSFLQRGLPASSISGKSVLEVGSYDRGDDSIRQILEPLGPGRYVGVDLEMGPGVDEAVNALELTEHFGESAFDVVISTEMIEHIENWRRAVSKLKRVVAPNGKLVVTTRSRGFHLHAYPSDWWRYEKGDFEAIFSDFESVVVECDPLAPGVFVSAVKPELFIERDLGSLKIYSVAFRRRMTGTDPGVNRVGNRIVLTLVWVREKARGVLPDRVKSRLKQVIGH
jgi:SAM-dependent methyltransferase